MICEWEGRRKRAGERESARVVGKAKKGEERKESIREREREEIEMIRRGNGSFGSKEEEQLVKFHRLLVSNCFRHRVTLTTNKKKTTTRTTAPISPILL